MFLTISTVIASIGALYFGTSVISSSVDLFYVFLILQVSLIVLVKIAHHSSETNIRVDTAGGLFILFSSSALILYSLQVISNTILFKGI